MRTAPKIELTPAERTQLESWARGRRTEARLVQRAKIVLLAATGKMNKEIAEELGSMPASVCLWRGRFAKGRLAAIEKDAPRCGRKSWVRVGVEAEIVQKTTQEKPANATHWSRSSMAKAVGVSDSTVGRVWKAHEKSQIQALDRRQLCLPFGAGYSATRTHDYK